MKRYNDYDTFAWLYNKEWGGFADNIFPSLQSIAGEKLFNGAKILDLCCGTGQLAKVLTAKVTRLQALTVLANAALRQRKRTVRQVFLKDARAFKLPPKYDIVFSTFDALNHIMTLEELEQVFKNAFDCLEKAVFSFLI